jgi:hypothetical protein
MIDLDAVFDCIEARELVAEWDAIAAIFSA